MAQTHTTQQTSQEIYWKRHKRELRRRKAYKEFFFSCGEEFSTVGIGEFSSPEFGANPGIGGSSLAEIGGFW